MSHAGYNGTCCPPWKPLRPEWPLSIVREKPKGESFVDRPTSKSLDRTSGVDARFLEKTGSSIV